MAPYCDTNFFVRLLIETEGTATALRKLQSVARAGSRPIPVTWLLQLEVANALPQAAFLSRQGPGSHFSSQQADVALAYFDEWLGDGLHFAPAPLASSELVREARRISLRHTGRHGFRAYDVAHVASALLLQCDTFWSFDRKASDLAKLEGLKVL